MDNYFVVQNNSVLYQGNNLHCARDLAMQSGAAFLTVEEGTTLEDIILRYKDYVTL